MPLYLVATPIGNLGDITLRALEVLKTCSYILCEDTRTSRVLLNHYEIRKPLVSYHKFNEKRREEQVLTDLASGQEIALISDAGTPLISDPGWILVSACRERELPVFVLPGACSAIAALSASGLPTERFQCLGFLPQRPGKRRKALEECLAYPGTSICYESPYRLVKTLHLLAEMDPTRPLVVARELTKKFESYASGTAPFLEALFTKSAPKGEIVLLIGPETS